MSSNVLEIPVPTLNGAPDLLENAACTGKRPITEPPFIVDVPRFPNEMTINHHLIPSVFPLNVHLASGKLTVGP